MQIPSVKELVRDREVVFRYLRDGSLWYEIEWMRFLFPVPVSDTGTATFLARDRAIVFMRWIRRRRDELAAEAAS